MRTTLQAKILLRAFGPKEYAKIETKYEAARYRQRDLTLRKDDERIAKFVKANKGMNFQAVAKKLGMSSYKVAAATARWAALGI